MPTTRPAVDVAAAISVTESAEVLVARTASGTADPLELGEELPLRLELLDDRLDHEVAVGEVAELGRQREPAHRVVARRLLELPLVDLAGEEVADPLARLLAPARA